MQVLRSYKRPVTSNKLAAKLGVSVRTLYRDIASLQAQGADIQGEPGLGYVLKPGFILPPLMFSRDEIEALVLGSRWVAQSTDVELANAARQVVAKVSAVIPFDLRIELETSALLVGPKTLANDDSHAADRSTRLIEIRRAINKEQILSVRYLDAKGKTTKRQVWPFAIGFFDQVQMMVAWCETRQDYRHFRLDRIAALALTDVKYPRRRLALLKEWRAQQGIAESS
jgi:predicted DNA-binding transcriptional regulator YafY